MEKDMNGRIITGIVLVGLGVCLLALGFIFIWTVIYAVILLIFGIIILFNHKEDKIEQINYKKHALKGGK